MTRQEKINLAIEKGITCDIETGKVYGVYGKELISNHNKGYRYINTGKNQLLQHQFIYFMATGKIVEQIDHINGDRADNRIVNLREATNQQNCFNRTESKGYTLHKKTNKWQSRITLNGKIIHLGLFDTETEARQAYLEAKKIYHII